MTPVEKWNAFSVHVDVPIGFAVVAFGVGAIAFRKKLGSDFKARVESGEMSAEEAAKGLRIFKWCGYCLVAGGFFLLALALFDI